MARPKHRRRRRYRHNDPSPKRRRRRRRYRHNDPEPRRRQRRHRRSYGRKRYRRNPPPVANLTQDVLWAGGGLLGTKFIGNMVMPMVGVTQPLARIAVKFGLAYVTAWLAEWSFGRRVFVPVFLGGSAEVIQDIVKTYVSPAFPALAAVEEPIESYYEPGLLGTYPGAYSHALQPIDEVAI